MCGWEEAIGVSSEEGGGRRKSTHTMRASKTRTMRCVAGREEEEHSHNGSVQDTSHEMYGWEEARGASSEKYPE